MSTERRPDSGSPSGGRAAPTLSICIATLNRADLIGRTLESITNQMCDAVEVVVVDGASRDSTRAVVSPFLGDARVRYIREETNSGLDQDYDKAVGYAVGDYCWLMTDDDVLRPGAIAAVLAAVELGEPVVVVNSRVMDEQLNECLLERMIPIESDAVVDPTAHDPKFPWCAKQMTFIGSVIVRRDFWQARDRVSYYGSLFIHVGVVLQAPPAPIRLIARPLVDIRYGNAMWTPRSFEIWLFKWPALVWSFDSIPALSRSKIVRREPWRHAGQLLMYRAIGAYSIEEYRRHLDGKPIGWLAPVAWLVARLPGRLLNLLGTIYFLAFKRDNRLRLYDLLASRQSGAVARSMARYARRLVS